MKYMKRILIVFGTRPEAIKICPLIKELQRREAFCCRVCVTGQHQELLNSVLPIFDVTPELVLSVMREGQSLSEMTARLLQEVGAVLDREAPDWVLVHGDTTTAFASALAAFYRDIPIGHVEAGLRTYDMRAPFPEEWNRRAIGLMAAHHFAPTVRAKEHLLTEGIVEERISVTGNTGIDALMSTVREDYRHPLLDWVGDSRLILLTAHRRENLGAPMRSAFRAIRGLVEELPTVKVIYPVHANPVVRQIANEELAGHERIRLTEPLDATDFHNFLARCELVVTDSGGIQEEAPALGKPVLVLRNTTERPEGLQAGVMRLIGTGEGSVSRGIRELLENRALYDTMARAVSPYGDGKACVRIADRLEELCEDHSERPSYSRLRKVD